MILESIHIKNYRQYIDEKIVFAKPEGLKNFTIIQGANGSGKTNLLNAITWCLYGIEKHLVKKQKGLPIVNMSNMEQLRDGGIKDVYVEIVMLDEEHDKIVFTRTLDFRKSMDGKIKEVPDSLSPYPDGSKFQIMRQIKNEMEIINNPKYILNHLIPEKLEEYFFFDGERLNDYFKDKSGNKIREEVLKISQIDLIESAIKHLKSKQNEFLKETGKLNPKVEEIREKIAIYSSSHDRHIENLKQKLHHHLEDAFLLELPYQLMLRRYKLHLILLSSYNPLFVIKGPKFRFYFKNVFTFNRGFLAMSNNLRINIKLLSTINDH